MRYCGSRRALSALTCVVALITVPVKQQAFAAPKAAQEKGTASATKPAAATSSTFQSSFQFNGKPGKFERIDSGPGLIVCDPVLKNAKDDLPAISRGCAAWIQLVVAGQPQCGKTSFWKSARRVQLEMGRQDLRLDKKEAAKLAQYLGASHLLLGTIEGNSADCALSYQIYKAPSMQPQGEILKISGSKAEIANQMPKLAAQICNNLEITPEHLPDMPPGLAELALVGQIQARAGETITAKQAAELQKLSTSSSLAGLIYLDTTTPIDPALKETAANLIQQEPINALIFGEIGWVQGKLLQFSARRLAANIKHFPNNYLFKSANVYFDRVITDGKSELDAARACVQLAPENPDAWLTLAQSYSYAADRIRKGRFYTDLTSSEKRQFDETYPLWLGCAEQAVKIDPLFGRAWLRTSTAAAYAGFLDEADKAFQKALELDRENYNVYWWGLQLYQPKWCNKVDKLKKLAEVVSKDRTVCEPDKRSLARLISNYPELVKLLVPPKEAPASNVARNKN